jgi:hypothetical protein
LEFHQFVDSYESRFFGLGLNCSDLTHVKVWEAESEHDFVRQGFNGHSQNIVVVLDSQQSIEYSRFVCGLKDLFDFNVKFVRLSSMIIFTQACGLFQVGVEQSSPLRRAQTSGHNGCSATTDSPSDQAIPNRKVDSSIPDHACRG